MASTTVYVKNISPETHEKEIKEFFSFCGKITSLTVKPEGETQSAEVTFEKETAAKTALLLDHTQLGATQVSVSSAAGHTDDSPDHSYKENADRDTDEITQEEKPRSRILAEYLAHGYRVGDQGIQRAIDLDHKHGVSARFLNTLTKLDAKYHATDKAKSVDQSYGVTTKANSLLSGLNSYFEKAAGTPSGQKVVNFYTQTSRQVVDIHNEAMRLADIKKKEAAAAAPVPESEKTTCKCGSISGNCACEPGHCACANCEKSVAKEVPGTKDTTCDCGGKSSDCTCKDEHCACSSCPKSDVKEVPGTNKTTCNCGGETSACSCKEGHCSCSSCSKSG